MEALWRASGGLQAATIISFTREAHDVFHALYRAYKRVREEPVGRYQPVRPPIRLGMSSGLKP